MTKLTDQPLRDLTEEEIENYNKFGAWVVRDILPNGWITYMREIIDDAMGSSLPFASYMQANNNESRFYTDMFSWRFNEGYSNFVMKSPLAIIAAQAMRSKTVNFFYDQTFVKEPGTVVPTPWHQDLSYWPVKGQQVISLWVPFDHVGPESSAVKYVKGSHHWDLQYRPPVFTQNEQEAERHEALINTFETANYDEVPDIDADPDRYEILSWELGPRDLILHHPLTIHGSTGNASENIIRRAIAMRYTGDDVTYYPEHANFIPPPILDKINLRSGDKLGGTMFPLLIS